MAFITDNGVAYRTSPDRINPACMTSGIGTGLSGRVVGAAILKGNGFLPVHVKGPIDMLGLTHAAGGDCSAVAVETGADNGLGVTVFAGVSGKDMPHVGVGSFRARPFISIHGHGAHPFLDRRPAAPVIMALDAFVQILVMAMTGVAIPGAACPGISPHFRIDSGAVTMTIGI